MQDIILWMYLIMGSIWDLKERVIPVRLCVAALVGLAIEGAFGGDLFTAEKMAGMLIGVILCVISRVTEGQVGEGDGITFLISGLAVGFWENFLLLFDALSLSFIWSVGCLVRKKMSMQSRMPFVPFVLAAFGLRSMLAYYG